MKEADFAEQFMCNLQPDPRRVELENKLIRYYKESENLDNRAARILWQETRKWARYSGFTNDEFNKVKRYVAGLSI